MALVMLLFLALFAFITSPPPKRRVKWAHTHDRAHKQTRAHMVESCRGLLLALVVESFTIEEQSAPRQ
uniref:Putative secreted protein n=1 Tax=Anopheles triannulatus TaxID=58253 RepID=A0A2M4B7U7_9DIPT